LGRTLEHEFRSGRKGQGAARTEDGFDFPQILAALDPELAVYRKPPLEPPGVPVYGRPDGKAREQGLVFNLAASTGDAEDLFQPSVTAS
jgi:hypothetical protein